jgi:hypothetical protein
MHQPVQTYRGRLDESHCQKYEESARGFSRAWMKLDRFSDRVKKRLEVDWIYPGSGVEVPGTVHDQSDLEET